MAATRQAIATTSESASSASTTNKKRLMKQAETKG